jgi:two-component system, NarL family, sensor histidine kinase UhpB
VKRPALLTQILAVNAVLIAATVLAATVTVHLDPDAVADRRRLWLLIAAVAATVLVNGLVLRRRFAPLEQLIAAMESVDFSARRSAGASPSSEVQEVARLRQAFDRMLERVETERARTASAVLHAQESERARVARDLHDEANQALTGVLLRLQATAQDAPEALRDELRETQRVATQAMEELLRLARELRPAALDDLGLAAALRTLVAEFGRRTGIRAELTVSDGALAGLAEDPQLVVYRVVQESLSNVARHAGATRLSVSAMRGGGWCVVRIADDGRGFDPSASTGGLGLTGMRERAVLAGGRLAVRSAPGDGTTIELRLEEGAGA